MIFAIISLLSFVITIEPADGSVNGCSTTGAAAPNTEVAGIDGYTAEQMGNAQTIIQVGFNTSGVTSRDQIIAIMTAIQESSLINLDHGDRDSLGLYQQRPSQGWGTPEQIMDPQYAAGKFYEALLKVPNRESLTPAAAAQAVQRSAYPDAYTARWPDATRIFAALTSDAGQGEGCVQNGSFIGVTVGKNGPVATSGWARPAAGPITSGFGERKDPINGNMTLHTGTDLGGGGRGGPIYAAYPGTVISVGFDASGNGTIIIDHGNGVQTRYLHEDQPALMVRVGQTVVAGQQIGQVGSSGHATGPHCHFEVRINGQPIDAVPFMAARGINLNDR